MRSFSHSILSLFAATMFTSALASPLPQGPPQKPDDISVFSINEMDDDPAAAARNISVPSQDWVRAWFKWKLAPDLRSAANLVELAHSHGALFGGAITCSAFFRGENGTSEGEFLDYATRDPDGKLYLISGAYYHGSVANPAYLNYILKWVKLQIDAGADTLFMDEVSGVYSPHEGYDKYGLAAFRQYLIHRFMDGKQWTATDRRWRTQFGVDLNNSEQCPNGTIRTFDYAAYLRSHGWSAEPSQSANPMWPLWGIGDAITGDSFSAQRNNAAWKFWVTALRAYASYRDRHVWLAANGLNHWVDYQITGIYGGFPRDAQGHFSCTASNLPHWRSEYNRSRTLMNGKDVPIMTFHDWGEGMPWEQLSAQERVAWLNAYAPEVFASGLFFAYPVHGPFGSDAGLDGTLATTRQQVAFVKTIAPFLHHNEWQDPAAALFSGPAEITILAQPNKKRLILHLINRKYNGLDPLPQHGGTLRLALSVRPTAVNLYCCEKAAPNTPTWTYAPKDQLPGRSGFGVLEVAVPDLDTWDVLEVQLPEWKPLPDANAVRVICSPVWERPSMNRFPVSGTSASVQAPLNAFVQGKLHPDLRHNPTFRITLRKPGSIQIHVNSTAQSGARLLVRVDGHETFAEGIPDQDHQDDPGANEINKDYSIPLPAGRHTIAVDNDGPDWLTVDWYQFTGL